MMISYKGNKKAANRKGLAAHDRSVSYFFYGLYIYIYMAEELLNWLSLWPPNFVSSLFTLHSSFFTFYTSFNTVSNLSMKSSTFSLVNTNGGRIRRMLVPAQPVKQCCSWMSLLRTSL